MTAVLKFKWTGQKVGLWETTELLETCRFTWKKVLLCSIKLSPGKCTQEGNLDPSCYLQPLIDFPAPHVGHSSTPCAESGI